MKNITSRHRRFVEAYCEHFNGARAAREAGYAESHDAQQASRLLSDPDISAMVEERLEDLAMSSAEATKRMAEIAEAEIGDYFELWEAEDGTTHLQLDKEAVVEDGGPVKELSWDQNGRPKLKLYDGQKALKTILDAHGAFNHKKEMDVTSDGEPVTEVRLQVVETEADEFEQETRHD